MGGRKPARKKPSAARKKTPARRPARSVPSPGSFPDAFAKLLRSRKIAVPKGLASAPPEAYASQPPEMVAELAKQSDADLKRFAERVAGYAGRQAKRAKVEWERSPLIAELRRRKLKEPPPPARPTGASVSLATPLTEWSDAELVEAARQWSALGR